MVLTDISQLEKIIDVLKTVLKLSHINEFSEMGSPPQWNSLTHVEILIELEKKFNLPIEMHQLPELTSVKKISLFLKSKC